MKTIRPLAILTAAAAFIFLSACGEGDTGSPKSKPAFADTKSTNPHFPASGPAQRLFPEPPAKSKFLL